MHVGNNIQNQLKFTELTVIINKTNWWLQPNLLLFVFVWVLMEIFIFRWL